MDDLWFDLAIKGEPDLEEDVLARLHLSDGADADLNGEEGRERDASREI